MTARLGAGGRVLVELELRLEDGTLAEDSKKTGNPVLLQLGNDSLSHAFEEALTGCAEGEQIRIELDAVDAFGERNPGLIQFMQTHQFPQHLGLKEGLIVGFTQADGSELPGIIRGINGTSVEIDFNHPLAGHRVRFDLKIRQLNPATRAETGQSMIAEFK